MSGDGGEQTGDRMDALAGDPAGTPAGRPIALALVVAVADNGIIGKNGDMPWRLPSDLKRFRRLTMGKPVIMGRRTLEAIGRPLDGRANLVLSRDPEFKPDGVTVFADLDAAIAAGRAIAARDGVDEVMVIGGGAVYAAAWARADRLHVTHVQAEPDGDTWFPPIGPPWRPLREETLEAGPKDSAAMRLVVYERV